MPTQIKCPSCQFEFPLEDALHDELNEAIGKEKEQLEKERQDLREKMLAYQKKKSEEFDQEKKIFEEKLRAVEAQTEQRIEQEKKKQQADLETQYKQKFAADFENQLRVLRESNEEKENKLKEAQQKELDFLRKEAALKDKEANLELQVQKQLQEARQSIMESVRKQEQEKLALKETEHSLKLKELEKQLDDQKKLADEMRRKAEQGSMQLQGEIQELALESLLRDHFRFDAIIEVGKGVKGADCMLEVRNQFGQACGKIIFESKRTEHFSVEWIEKLKADMRSQGADIAVLVTKSMPKDVKQFGQKEGVWICSFQEVAALVQVLRDGILRVYQANKNQENKGDKMHLLYDYLTSNEFAEQWKAIREGFMQMKLSIQRERDAMEKLWKAREKQLEKVLINAAHVRGSIEGIAGSEHINLQFNEDETPLLPES
jgi:hypothetical protein